MGQRKTGRHGILPSTSTQVAIAMAQADITYRIARSQAARGVDPKRSADHALMASGAVLGYLFFIFPVVVFVAFLVWTWNPIVMLWKFVQVGIGIVILVRMSRWVQEPASNRLSYRIPTWSLVLAGGLSAFLFTMLCIVGIALGYGD